jgi:hypothetical protein
MSLEQDMFYSSHIERRNADYFVLMRIRDVSSMQEFYKRYCSDIRQARFIDLYEMAVKPVLGFIIIDLVCPFWKYRINSLNIFYNSEIQKLCYILGEVDASLNELNMQIKYEPTPFKNQNNKNATHNYEKPTQASTVHNAIQVTKINQNANNQLPIQKNRDAAINKIFAFQHDDQPDKDITEFMTYHGNQIYKTLHGFIDHEVILSFTLHIELENREDWQAETGHLNSSGFTLQKKSLLGQYLMDVEKELQVKLRILQSRGELIFTRINWLDVRVHTHIPRQYDDSV